MPTKYFLNKKEGSNVVSVAILTGKDVGTLGPRIELNIKGHEPVIYSFDIAAFLNKQTKSEILSPNCLKEIADYYGLQQNEKGKYENNLTNQAAKKSTEEKIQDLRRTLRDDHGASEESYKNVEEAALNKLFEDREQARRMSGGSSKSKE